MADWGGGKSGVQFSCQGPRAQREGKVEHVDVHDMVLSYRECGPLSCMGATSCMPQLQYPRDCESGD
ncbi:hypothetical protein PanWU01x14_100970 [Parasponia andersonii]|uniref:Uncharacterized protein n=1 Tax=Parasponia andersonii TaxID=3476 RepID=A0A2P5D306_PARAD|nr:hypothetical protein PanWU01x14_100970 [Parasponia andersonii]